MTLVENFGFVDFARSAFVTIFRIERLVSLGLAMCQRRVKSIRIKPSRAY